MNTNTDPVTDATMNVEAETGASLSSPRRKTLKWRRYLNSLKSAKRKRIAEKRRISKNKRRSIQSKKRAEKKALLSSYKNSVALVIPCRLESSRLPNKMLQELNGKPVIFQSFVNAKLSGYPVYVVTDSPNIYLTLRKLLPQYSRYFILDSRNAHSGTHRLSYLARMTEEELGGHYCKGAITKLKEKKYWVNIQGDEPFLEPKHIRKFCLTLAKHKEQNADNSVFTLTGGPRGSAATGVIVENGICKSFSREKVEGQKKHIGVYGYSVEFLASLRQVEPVALEQTLWTVPIRAININTKSFGIDTIEDLEMARAMVSQEKSKRKYKGWTKEEAEEFARIHETKTIDELAAHFNKGKSTVYLYKKKLKEKLPLLKDDSDLVKNVRTDWTSGAFTLKELKLKYGTDVGGIVRNRTHYDPNYNPPSRKHLFKPWTKNDGNNPSPKCKENAP